MSKLLKIFVMTMLLIAPVRGEIIDRVLAVVEGQLITLSDVRAVLQLGFERVPPGDAQIRLVLDRLIDRQLMLIEVDRYGPPEPSPAGIEAGAQDVRARFKDVLEFETTLHHIGMTVDHVRRYVRDSLRIEAYLQQRFTVAIQPTEDEIAAYYQLRAAEFSRGGAARPYAEVRNEVRQQLIAERQAALVREWLAGLRRRANITDLYVTTSVPGR